MQGLWFLPSVIFGAVQGFSTGSWQMLVFSLLSLSIWPLSRWLKTNRDFALEGPVSFDGKDVWIGDHRLPRREIFWRKSWQKYLADGFALQDSQQQRPAKLEHLKADGFRGSAATSNWLGFNVDQSIEFDIAESGPHLLIVGATGTGKSELLRILVTGWLHQVEDVELALIDFKGGATLARYSGHPRVIALATDLQATEANQIAETFERHLAHRQAEFSRLRASSIEDLSARGGQLNRELIVIDELGELLRQHPRLTASLEQIAARGRSLGMHLVATNQSMSGISRGLMVNLRARIAIGEMDPIDFSQMGFRTRQKSHPSSSFWRSAKLRNCFGAEMDFEFPIGF